VDNLGRSYWVSIDRVENEDPYFPIRMKTDSIPDDVEKLLVSIRRIYLPDREAEMDFEHSFHGKEEEILQNISNLGDKEPVSIEIKEINKRLRELERERFFRLPVIKKDMIARWNFSVSVDLSLRKKNHKIFRLEGEFSSGDFMIKPERLVMGVMKNELICRYNNNDLQHEIIKNSNREESDDFIIFLEDEIPPILPDITISFFPDKEESFCQKEISLYNKSMSKKLILSPDKELLLYYCFEPFDCCPHNIHIELDAMEIQPTDFPEINLVPGEEVVAEIPVFTEKKETKIPVEVSISKKEISSESSIVCGELTYSFHDEENISELVIMGSIYQSDTNFKYLPVRYKKVINGKKIEIHVFYNFPADDAFEKLLWVIKSYYFKLKKSIIINLNAIQEKTHWEPATSMLEGKVVMTANPLEME